MATSVLPITGMSNPMFTLLEVNGDNLHEHLIELNRLHADNEVRKNVGENLVSELERIKENIEESGVSRRDMEEVEATSGTALESFPIHAYTERKSRTGQQVALEEINLKTVGIVAAGIVAGLAFLYKLFGWFGNGFGGKSGGGAGGGAGGGGTNTASEDKEKVKEIEKLEEEIKSMEGRFGVSDTLTAEEKQRIQDMVAKYLDHRNSFVARLMDRNNSYSKAFSAFVPAFTARFNQEIELGEMLLDELQSFVADLDKGISERDLVKLTNLGAKMVDNNFNKHRWDDYQRFLKACGVSTSGGAGLIKDASTTLFNQFNKEIDKPSKLRASDLQQHGFRQINTDMVNILECIADQDNSGGSDRYYFIPNETTSAGLVKIEEIKTKLGEVGPKLKDKVAGVNNATTLRGLTMVGSLVSQFTDRVTMLNMPIMINKSMGIQISKFSDFVLNEAKTLVKGVVV